MTGADSRPSVRVTHSFVPRTIADESVVSARSSVSDALQDLVRRRDGPRCVIAPRGDEESSEVMHPAEPAFILTPNLFCDPDLVPSVRRPSSTTIWKHPFSRPYAHSHAGFLTPASQGVSNRFWCRQITSTSVPQRTPRRPSEPVDGIPRLSDCASSRARGDTTYRLHLEGQA